LQQVLERERHESRQRDVHDEHVPRGRTKTGEDRQPRQHRVQPAVLSEGEQEAESGESEERGRQAAGWQRAQARQDPDDADRRERAVVQTVFMREPLFRRRRVDAVFQDIGREELQQVERMEGKRHPERERGERTERLARGVQRRQQLHAADHHPEDDGTSEHHDAHHPCPCDETVDGKPSKDNAGHPDGLRKPQQDL
jgi:hypothetical protein